MEGGERLHGVVQVRGAKNGILPVLAACLMSNGQMTLSNVPNISDVQTMTSILAQLGLIIEYGEDESGTNLKVEAKNPISTEVPYDLAREIRGSIFLLGPLLARTGEAIVPFPGGDDLGARPIDLHIDAMKALGAEIKVDHGCVVARCSRLKGARFLIDPYRSRGTSVGVTHNLIMAGCFAEGETIIENAAREPEVVDLAVFLNSMGAKIRGAGTDTVKIEQCGELSAKDHSVIPDRIEAGTYMLAGAITGGDVTVDGIVPQYLRMLSWSLEQAGCRIEEFDNSIRVIAPKRLSATNIMTGPYPGFATDLQAPYAAAMTVADGTSIIAENIYDSRFTYFDELTSMGADIKLIGNRLIISGISNLRGAPVEGSDIRAVVSLVLAGLAAQGETIVSGLHHLDRGYEHVETKLQALGANLVRI